MNDKSKLRIDFARALEIVADAAEQLGLRERAHMFRAESQFHYNCYEENGKLYFRNSENPKGKRHFMVLRVCPDGHISHRTLSGRYIITTHPISLFPAPEENSEADEEIEEYFN
jgi:hypothetical protein